MRKKIFKNTAILSCVEGFNLVCGTVIVIVLARILGKSALGIFSFSFAVGAILSVLSLHGLTDLIIREVARDPGRGGYYFFNTFFVRLVFIVPLVLIGLLVTAIRPYSGAERMTIMLFIIARMGESFVFMICGFFRGFQDFIYEGVIRFCLYAINVVGTVLILVLYKDLLIVGAWQAGLYIIFSTVAFLFVQWKYHFAPACSWCITDLKKVMKTGYAFLLVSALVILLSNINTVILNLIKGEISTGIYSAAFRFVGSLGVLGVGCTAAFYPVLSKYASENKQALANDVFYDGFKYLLAGSVFLAGFLWYFSPELIRLFYGGNYEESIVCLRIISVKLVFTFLNTLCSYFLFSQHEEWRYIRYLVATMVLAVLISVIVIPRGDYIGASIATTLPEVICFAFQFFAIRKNVKKITDMTLYLRMAAAIVIAGGLMFLIKMQPIAVLMPLFCIAYIAALFFFRVIRKDEIGLMMKALRYH